MSLKRVTISNMLNIIKQKNQIEKSEFEKK